MNDSEEFKRLLADGVAQFPEQSPYFTPAGGGLPGMYNHGKKQKDTAAVAQHLIDEAILGSSICKGGTYKVNGLQVDVDCIGASLIEISVFDGDSRVAMVRRLTEPTLQQLQNLVSLLKGGAA